MRAIKFRMFEHKSGKMFYDCYPTQAVLSLVDLAWMQFTGLCDKNGKEIFQSDLIRDDAGYLWEVSDGYDGFYLLSREENLRPDRGIFERYKYLSVIGNVYENPELITL